MIKKIIVSGSLAYDRIMDFPGYFHEHILPEKIHELNVSFQVNSLKEKFGGTAGNIAYALSLLGEHPLISATIGQDYQRYFSWLQSNGISTEGIKVIPDDFTASAYITTDKSNNQITGFHVGAMNYSSALDINLLNPAETLMIISPGNIEDMRVYPQLCKAREIEYIFDPGQSLPMLQPADLVQAITGCRILVSNDYELELIIKKTGLNKNDLLQRAGAIIVTQGEHGSRIFTTKKEFTIPAIKPRKVVDPTGAGDSYRGGLISGLVRNLGLEQSAVMGAACASFCVECVGTQEYRFTPADFAQRLESHR